MAVRSPRLAKAKRPAKPRKPRRASGVQLGEDVARKMILMAAAQVFPMQGFRNASVEHLLEASKVSRRTFYRIFKSKEDVALALYVFGTNNLLANWRRELENTTEPLDQFARVIDVYLKNAAMMGRLIYVLAGEAQRLESPLCTRRLEVHATLYQLLCDAHPDTARLEPLLVRTVLYALESATRQVVNEGDEGRRIPPEAIERVRRVMLRLVTAALLGSGPGVTPLPLAGE